MLTYTNLYDEYLTQLYEDELHDTEPLDSNDVDPVFAAFEDYFEVDTTSKFPTVLTITAHHGDTILHLSITHERVSCFIGEILSFGVDDDGVVAEIGHVYNAETFEWVDWFNDVIDRLGLEKMKNISEIP